MAEEHKFTVEEMGIVSDPDAGQPKLAPVSLASGSELSTSPTDEAVNGPGLGADISENDPMVLAIQEQIGKEFAPPGGGAPLSQMNALGPFMENELFRVVNLTKSYGSGAGYVEVIKGISFTVKQGEYIVIYGASGSGKSTLLHLLAGMEVPTRGEIRVRDVPIKSFSDDELAYYHREVVGLVFQSSNLLESISVMDNVAFPLMLEGAPKEWRRHEALRILDRFGLGDFAGHYPNQLSGGQQQRVSLARALVNDPEMLLIDEPTGNLDSKSADAVIHEIDRLHKQENRTIILVTHSQVFLPFATRVFYIKDGTLLTSDEHGRLNTME
jgi:putative ABC transport system ATP-binding protein